LDMPFGWNSESFCCILVPSFMAVWIFAVELGI
jgi:hypothetical protein